MKTSIHHILIGSLLAATLGGCGTDANSDDGDGSTGGSASGDTTSDATTNPTTTATTSATQTTTMGTTVADSSSSEGPLDTGSSSSGGGDDGFVFAEDPYDAYMQIDRHAAVEAGTAGIAGPEGLGFNRGSDISIRDAYNMSNPAEDAAGMWLDEIVASVTFFHGALDDDITGLGLTPATLDQTVAQAGPVIVPDTIKYDPSQPTGYPNGRALTDPVVDITLAAVLLELGPDQPLTLFADLPLNPPANDVPFKDEFPYLADPH